MLPEGPWAYLSSKCVASTSTVCLRVRESHTALTPMIVTYVYSVDCRCLVRRWHRHIRGILAHARTYMYTHTNTSPTCCIIQFHNCISITRSSLVMFLLLTTFVVQVEHSIGCVCVCRVCVCVNYSVANNFGMK